MERVGPLEPPEAEEVGQAITACLTPSLQLAAVVVAVRLPGREQALVAEAAAATIQGRRLRAAPVPRPRVTQAAAVVAPIVLRVAAAVRRMLVSVRRRRQAATAGLDSPRLLLVPQSRGEAAAAVVLMFRPVVLVALVVAEPVD